MHDMLFEHQDALDEEYLVAYAAAIGLDVDEFSREMLLGVHAPRVREDFLSGVRSGVNGTPTFFINGYRHNGSYDLQTAGGTIQVRLGVQNVPGGVSKAIVAVHDEGQGLEQGELDRIFALCEQAEQPSVVGLGLGLYLARQIARMHGGDLWAESRGRMNGSTFILALPATG